MTAHQYIMQFHALQHDIVPTRTYYKGHRIQSHDPSFCQLPEKRSISAFSIIVADDISFGYDRNGSIASIKRPQDRQFRWFDVTYNTMHNPWQVHERRAEDTPEQLPQDAIYILCDPDIIDQIQAHQVNDTTYISIHCVAPDHTDHTIKTIHANMASLDAQAYHTDLQHHERHEQRVTISMLCNLP